MSGNDRSSTKLFTIWSVFSVRFSTEFCKVTDRCGDYMCGPRMTNGTGMSYQFAGAGYGVAK